VYVLPLPNTGKETEKGGADGGDEGGRLCRVGAVVSSWLVSLSLQQTTTASARKRQVASDGVMIWFG